MYKLFMSDTVIDCCLNTNSAFFQLYHGENKLINLQWDKDKVLFVLDQRALELPYRWCNGCVVDCGFEPRSGQTKYYKIGICCFSAKHAALWRKSKDWLTRNQNNVSEKDTWSDGDMWVWRYNKIFYMGRKQDFIISWWYVSLAMNKGAIKQGFTVLKMFITKIANCSTITSVEKVCVLICCQLFIFYKLICSRFVLPCFTVYTMSWHSLMDLRSLAEC
jgi:hypothetical protein